MIGEGAGALILEALEHAEARGAEPLAEIIGYGATADASHITLPSPGGIGAVRAARRALAKAGIQPSDIDHINAHATSTPDGDTAELQAIRDILGDAAGEVAITASKSCSVTPSVRPGRSRRARSCAPHGTCRRRSTSTTPTRRPPAST